METLRQFLDFQFVWDNRDYIAGGFVITLKLTGVITGLVVPLGLLVALLRLYGPRLLSPGLHLGVAVARSIPPLVAVVLIFFAFPFLGILVSPFVSVVIALTVVETAFFSEIFRGALLAIGYGQLEAGYACGLTTVGCLRRIILPQAARIAAPAFTSRFVQLVQATTIATVVALSDLLSRALTLQTNTGNGSALLAAAALYVAFLLPLVRLARFLEARLARSV